MKKKILLKIKIKLPIYYYLFASHIEGVNSRKAVSIFNSSSLETLADIDAPGITTNCVTAWLRKRV